MTDPDQEPQPRARAAIGRAMGRLGLDRRSGVGLRPDGLPDIDWVAIPGPAPFVYQESTHPGLPSFHLARYPITHAQFQAFIDAGGYQDPRWWQGLAQRMEAPQAAEWDEPNSPRETVSWYEAVAFCRWLSAALREAITLPTEEQWERAARGRDGREYPWGDYRSGHANWSTFSADEELPEIARTSAVGLYPQGASAEGVLDLAGNIYEWCLNEDDSPERTGSVGIEFRVLRGGSWNDYPVLSRGHAQLRGHSRPPRPQLRLSGVSWFPHRATGRWRAGRCSAGPLTTGAPRSGARDPYFGGSPAPAGQVIRPQDEIGQHMPAQSPGVAMRGAGDPAPHTRIERREAQPADNRPRSLRAGTGSHGVPRGP